MFTLSCLLCLCVTSSLSLFAVQQNRWCRTPVSFRLSKCFTRGNLPKHWWKPQFFYHMKACQVMSEQCWTMLNVPLHRPGVCWWLHIVLTLRMYYCLFVCLGSCYLYESEKVRWKHTTKSTIHSLLCFTDTRCLCRIIHMLYILLLCEQCAPLHHKVNTLYNTQVSKAIRHPRNKYYTWVRFCNRSLVSNRFYCKGWMFWKMWPAGKENLHDSVATPWWMCLHVICISKGNYADETWNMLMQQFSNESVFICLVVNYRLTDTASRSYNTFNISVDIMFVGKHLPACLLRKKQLSSKALLCKNDMLWLWCIVTWLSWLRYLDF